MIDSPVIDVEIFIFRIDHIWGKWYLDGVSRQYSASTIDSAAGLQRLSSDKHKVSIIEEKYLCRN